MILINNINDVIDCHHTFQHNKMKLLHINPQIQNIQCRMLVCKSNSIIFAQGEMGKNLYYILSGQLTCLTKNEDAPPTKCKFQRQQTNDYFIQQIISAVPDVTLISRQYFPCNQHTHFAHLHPGDTFGEAKGKRAYTVITERDAILIELIFDEKYWRCFEMRHSFLEKLNVASDLQLLSACLKEKNFKYGDYIYSQDDQKQWIYMIISGEVNLMNNNTVIYSLGEGQIFGFEAFLRNSTRRHSVKCISASMSCYVTDSLNFFNISQLEKLAKARNLMIYQIQRQKKQIFQISKSNGVDQTFHQIGDKQSFYNQYWFKDLNEMPRWNLEQLTRDAGATPGQGIIKSKQYKTPILDSSQDYSMLSSRISSIKPCSVFDVNPEQNKKLIKSYLKRMRAEKYAEYHACLKGNWDLFDFSKISHTSTVTKRQSSMPQQSSYVKRSKALQSQYTQNERSINQNDFTQSPIKILSEVQPSDKMKKSKEMATMTVHPFRI